LWVKRKIGTEAGFEQCRDGFYDKNEIIAKLQCLHIARKTFVFEPNTKEAPHASATTSGKESTPVISYGKEN